MWLVETPTTLFLPLYKSKTVWYNIDGRIVTAGVGTFNAWASGKVGAVIGGYIGGVPGFLIGTAAGVVVGFVFGTAFNQFWHGEEIFGIDGFSFNPGGKSIDEWIKGFLIKLFGG